MNHTNFIKNLIEEDLESGKHTHIVMRFPPEPNGFLHIGHAKAICLNFTLAEAFKGQCHLRFDDTNPLNEEEHFARAIEEDIRWLGFDWGDCLYHTSDYFDELYALAVKLIRAGKAYVDSLSPEAMRDYRGTLTEPGRDSPDRNRPVEESLALFERMRQGEFPEGAYTLRAKIDMASGNMNMRDPALYRIRHAQHPRTQEAWCIYPMYDFSHALSDAIEGITHSLCTLEFQDHRPLYDWCVQACEMPCQPQQLEFSRLNLSYTVTSKRKLKALIDAQVVSGWDDPRMPTLRGMRRRGVPAAALRQFCASLGVSKQNSVIDVGVFEQVIRDYLNQHALRRSAVLRPLKVTLMNWAEGETQTLSVPNHPQNQALGRRTVTFGREIYIDAEDFQCEPQPGFHRLSPGKRVRLANAYVIRCEEVVRDQEGHVIALKATYDADTLGGKKPADGVKIKGILHWVHAAEAQDAEVRLYGRLFSVENPGAEDDLLACVEPDSLKLYQAKIEPALAKASPEETFQFNRVGYFVADRHNFSQSRLVFNQTVTLRETRKPA